MLNRALLLFGLVLVVSACEKKQPAEAVVEDSSVAVAPPAASSATTHHRRFFADAGGGFGAVRAPIIETIEVPEVRVRKDAPTDVRVTWVTPKGTAVNDEAPFRVRWNRSDGLADAPTDVKSTGSAVKDGFTVQVKPMSGAPNASLTGEINIVVCDSATHSVCVPVRRSVELGFVVTKDATAEALVKIPLPEARAQN